MYSSADNINDAVETLIQFMIELDRGVAESHLWVGVWALIYFLGLMLITYVVMPFFYMLYMAPAEWYYWQTETYAL